MALSHAGDEIFVGVDTLRATIDLKTSEEEVKASREGSLRGVLKRIEGACVCRESSNEDEVRSVLCACPLGNIFLVGGF